MSLGGCTSASREARAEARKFWEKSLTKCGDYAWTEVIAGEIAEYKNFDYTVHEIPLSETDKTLNKVEWTTS